MVTRPKTVLCQYVVQDTRPCDRLTFRVVLVRMLQVLHYTILTDDLLDLALCVDIERVFVQQPHLILSLALTISLGS